MGFKNNGLPKINNIVPIAKAPNNIPITVNASVVDALYSIYLPVLLLINSNNLCAVTVPSV